MDPEQVLNKAAFERKLELTFADNGAAKAFRARCHKLRKKKDILEWANLRLRVRGFQLIIDDLTPIL